MPHEERAIGGNLGGMHVALIAVAAMPLLAAARPSGTPAPGQGFYTLPPCRVIDTRDVAGVPFGGPALTPGVRTFNVRERCGLPGNAIAASFNLTITGPTAAGNLRLYPGGASSSASAINYLAGQTRANNGIVPLSANGELSVQCDQVQGTAHVIMDVNGYFAATDEVPTPVGQRVRIRPAPEVEITFDEVTGAGITKAQVIEFLDNRATAIDQSLQDFFPVGSPFRSLLPPVIVPSFVKPLGKGSAAGPPTFVLSIIDTNAAFLRTAEFHGFEDFRLGWDPPCVVPADQTQEPRTFYAPESAKGEPALVEDQGFGGPVFVDISSGCGSNKGAGWNFSLYLTARDTRPPLEVARYMLQRMPDALTALAAFITNPTVASDLLSQAQSALASLDTNAPASLTQMNNFISTVDGNVAAFDNSTRNVRGELAGRALSARYMLAKVPGLPSGTVTSYPTLTPSSTPYGITTGADGNVWFAENGGNRIGRITPAGSMTEFAIPTATTQPWGITAGPDGNVWFTESAGNRIGRITPAGVITEFPVPTFNSGPLGITTGADGNLWFAEATASKIGRVTPVGVITEFSVPTLGSGPRVITGGPDGNVWFTETGGNGNKIGRITPAGVVTEFPIPTLNAVAYGITGGPDGNVWFTESSGNKVARITPAGIIAEFPVSNGAGPMGIVTGADGNLWIAGRFGSKILRVTTAGVATDFPVPLTNVPFEITSGSDGNLWFASLNDSSVSRFIP